MIVSKGFYDILSRCWQQLSASLCWLFSLTQQYHRVPRGNRPNSNVKKKSHTQRLLVTHSLNPRSAEFFTDADKRLDKLDAPLFPGVDPEVKVHSGFRNEHAVTASVVFNEVKRLMIDKKTKNITIVTKSLKSFKKSFYECQLGRAFHGWRIGRTRGVIFGFTITVPGRYPYRRFWCSEAWKPGVRQVFWRAGSQL